jgi:glycosyltransferase involved in cell wall biosynthesis
MMTPLNPKSGIEDFIDAAAIVSWHRPDVRFVILGQDDFSGLGARSGNRVYRKMVADRVNRLGLHDKVMLTEARADVVALLSDITGLILPTPRSGLPNVLRESMAADLPVVATRVDGTVEAVERGATWLLIPPSDPQELAAVLAQLLADPAVGGCQRAAGRQAVRDCRVPIGRGR